MQTTKLCSTISYNTPAFLAGTLRRLCDSGLIEFAHWIFHKAEEDETKDHFHVVLKPNRRLDTEALRKEFKELQLGTLFLLVSSRSSLRRWRTGFFMEPTIFHTF